MNKYLQMLAFLLIGSLTIQAQTIFEENFENFSLPGDWTIQSNASDGGWLHGSAAALSSDFFGIIPNGSNRIAATNDDNCNCDKSNEIFVTPMLDLTGYPNLVLKFDAFYTDQSYQGVQEHATILISLDSMATWEELEDLHGHGSWDTHIIDLSAFSQEDTVHIGFRYDDGGGWLYGFAIDNVAIEAPLNLDGQLVELNSLPYGEENIAVPISGTVFNNGTTEITSMEVSYSINSGMPVVEQLDNISIPAFSYYHFEVANPWLPNVAGDYVVDVEITSVNASVDDDSTNNAGAFDTRIYEKIEVPNRLEEFLAAPLPKLTEVANAYDQLDRPTDLDFFPILGKDEIWVVNQRNENSGGSTLTITDASAETPSDFLMRVDGNAWHFMSLPTGIAFSNDNFNFATSPGVKDANHSGGTFTGPTLWSSDPNIYAQPSGGNGSHLDMLHGSPFSMGIAHEVDNAFWIYDDWNKDIVRYDFVDDHGPGNDDHSDAIVRRYKNIGIDTDGDIPNHMVLDKSTGWLYFVDNGNDRVMRLDINSGSVGNSLPTINEPLAEHSQMTDFNVETIIESGLDRPCGIEILENRLLVGDYATGDIIVYDMDNGFIELGRIPTEESGLTGIKVGPDGSIWYTNRLRNTLTKAEPGDPNSTEEEIFAAKVKIAPNPSNGQFTVSLPELSFGSNISYQLTDLAGKQIMFAEGTNNVQPFNLAEIPNGMYLINIRTEQFSISKPFVLKR